MSRARWLALGAFVCVVVAAAGLASGFVSLAALQQRLGLLITWRMAHPWAAGLVFLLCYIVAASLLLPVNVVLALAGGAVFGPWLGTVLVGLSAATGSTLAMLASRWLLRGLVRRRFGRRFHEVEAGLAREGWIYLLSLRLMPAVPYTLVNLLFGLTGFPPGRFLLVSLLGMSPATILYVHAGTGLGQLTSLGDVLSGPLAGSLALLAAMPLVAGWIFRYWRRQAKH